MTTLLRKMWRSHSKHKKLSEEWALADYEEEGWWRAGAGGVGVVRYAGVAAVERAASAPATAQAVRKALAAHKGSHKNLQRVNLDISSKGVVVTDAETQDDVVKVSIYKISYCSADAANARVFVVVEGVRGVAGDAHVAHVFVCERRRHARALALALAHAFNDAYQAWQANQASTLHGGGGGGGERLAPWVRFHEESDEETDNEQWQDVVPPLVTFT